MLISYIISSLSIHEDKPFVGLSKYHKQRERKRRKHILNQKGKPLSTSMNSACEPYELTVWVSILNPGNKQVQISWSVESSDSALTQSSPFFVSHGSIYNQEHCFDKTVCHRFTLNDNSITFPFQNEEDNIKSIIVSINGLTALEITEQTLTSLSFKFGQCESISKNDVFLSPDTTKNEPERSQSPSPAPSSRLRYTYDHEPMISSLV